MKKLNDTFSYTVKAERSGNYAVEVFNDGDKPAEVEVEFKPINLPTWTNRIRFILTVPLAIIMLYLIAMYIEES